MTESLGSAPQITYSLYMHKLYTNSNTNIFAIIVIFLFSPVAAPPLTFLTSNTSWSISLLTQYSNYSLIVHSIDSLFKLTFQNNDSICRELTQS